MRNYKINLTLFSTKRKTWNCLPTNYPNSYSNVLHKLLENFQGNKFRGKAREKIKYCLGLLNRVMPIRLGPRLSGRREEAKPLGASQSPAVALSRPLTRRGVPPSILRQSQGLSEIFKSKTVDCLLANIKLRRLQI